MKILQPILFLTLFCLSFSTYAEDKITETDVLKMLEQIKTAVAERSVDDLVAHFVEEAVITVDMPDDMGGKMEMNLKDYKLLIEQGWALSNEYTYEVKDIEVTMHPDGLGATITDTVLEVAMIGDQRIDVETAETLEIISVAGKPMIKSLYGKASVDMQQIAWQQRVVPSVHAALSGIPQAANGIKAG